jgi:integrase/recombinase XerD
MLTLPPPGRSASPPLTASPRSPRRPVGRPQPRCPCAPVPARRHSQLPGVDRAEATTLLSQATVTAAGQVAARPPDGAGERQQEALERADRAHRLACPLRLNGLRVSEALSLDACYLATVRSHRVARVRRKGGRHQDVVLAPRTAQALDDYLEARGGAPAPGPLLITRSGARLERVRGLEGDRPPGGGGGDRPPRVPHALRHGFVTAALDAGVPLHRVQDAAGHRDRRTTRRYDRARGALGNHAAYAVGSYFTQLGAQSGEAP